MCVPELVTEIGLAMNEFRQKDAQSAADSPYKSAKFLIASRVKGRPLLAGLLRR
jgi:hypothetical protein